MCVHKWVVSPEKCKTLENDPKGMAVFVLTDVAIVDNTSNTNACSPDSGDLLGSCHGSALQQRLET